jgi:LEA14-like dessication related protein
MKQITNSASLRGVAVLLVAASIAACASWTNIKAPRLQIIGASMTSADVFSQRFRVRLHVSNPNTRDLPIKKIEYKLFLEGDSFAEGESEAAFVVPANGETEFDLAVSTNFVSSIGRLLSRLTGTDRRQIQYNFEGTVVVGVRFSPKIKFNETGMVDLTRQ